MLISRQSNPHGTSDFSVRSQQSAPPKAEIVDAQGNIVGYRQIRDPALLGPIGPQLRGEDMMERGSLRLRPTTIPAPEGLDPTSWPGSEVRTIVNQGPSENRIDLTIVGDGYTAEQKDKFFKDVERITQDLFGQETFKTYLPLFNVHAVFVPSKESGIGDGRPKNTALGLYRHGSIRQAVMPGNSSAARKAARLAPDSDYPILVANDPIYGGLGGEFAITTAAPLNITTVLRHELGHNFGDVGEEYDGGQVYSGANHSRSSHVSWQHWLPGGEDKVHKAELLHLSAPWQNLDRGAWEKNVSVPANSTEVVIDFSSTGFDTENDVRLLVDGKVVPFEGSFNYDRNFYEVRMPLGPGQHTIRFEQVVADGNNILSKVNVYALPPGYPKDVETVGAFATYNGWGRQTGYRPTAAGCLMRDMSRKDFCPVCVENMWEQFLRQVNLVDDVVRNGDEVEAKLVPLGADRMTVEWIGPDGKVRPELTNKTHWKPAAADKGRWKIRVSLKTDEVKAPDHERWSVHTKTFEID